ncbi:MAG: MbcA/ParS/Xre antitoxin family protein [Acidobacteriota bacterium]|nr:MbcA/ParS/Xre antitoxin family protein [Acidobacteriota bacterium]
MPTDIAEYIGVSPKSDFDLAEIIEHGLPSESLSLLKEKGLTFTEIADLIISPRTLQHRKAKGLQHLTCGEADRVVRVARVLVLADRIFGDYEKALAWLRTPDGRMNGRTALSLLQTESGGRLVEGMLWQIDEGMYS